MDILLNNSRHQPQYNILLEAYGLRLLFIYRNYPHAFNRTICYETKNNQNIADYDRKNKYNSRPFKQAAIAKMLSMSTNCSRIFLELSR